MTNTSFDPKPGWVRLICKSPSCNKVFYLQSSRVKWGKGSYCSQTCWISDMHRTRVGRRPTRIYATGPDNPRWKGIRAPKPCPVCGNTFSSPAKRCSRACADIARAKMITGANNPFARTHPAKQKTCQRCGITYRGQANGKGTGQFYCSLDCSIRNHHLSLRAMAIADTLARLGFTIEFEKSWPWLISPLSRARMRVDIYLPDLMVAIEYDGRHHYEPAYGQPERLERIQARDARKDVLLSQHGIRIIRVNGWPVDIDAIVEGINHP